MGKKDNVADSGYTPIQVGKVGGKGKPPKDTPSAKGDAAGATVNTRSGKAKVGVQADIIVGDLHIRM